MKVESDDDFKHRLLGNRHNRWKKSEKMKEYSINESRWNSKISLGMKGKLIDWNIFLSFFHFATTNDEATKKKLMCKIYNSLFQLQTAKKETSFFYETRKTFRGSNFVSFKCSIVDIVCLICTTHISTVTEKDLSSKESSSKFIEGSHDSEGGATRIWLRRCLSIVFFIYQSIGERGDIIFRSIKQSMDQ